MNDQQSADGPATPEQESELETLSGELGNDTPEGMTREGADEKINKLREKVAGVDGQEDGSADDSLPVTPISPSGNR